MVGGDVGIEFDDALVLFGGGGVFALVAIDGAEQEAGHDEVGVFLECGLKGGHGAVAVALLIGHRPLDIEVVALYQVLGAGPGLGIASAGGQRGGGQDDPPDRDIAC